MTATATVTFAASVSGLPTGSKAISLAYGPFTGAVAEILDTPLTAGSNTVAVPTGATWMVIQPPSANTVQLTLKGSTLDTGFSLDLTRATPIPLVPGTTSVIIGAASNVTPEISFI